MEGEQVNPPPQEVQQNPQTTPSEQKKKNHGFLSIDETEYMKRDLGDKDPRQARIQAMLADVTHPLSVLPVLREPYERSSEENTYTRFQTQEEKEKSINDGANFSLQKLMNMGSMITLRDEAQTLDTEFHNSNVTPDSDKELLYLRRTTELRAKMHQYVRDYLEYKYGWIHIDSLQASTPDIVKQMQAEVERAMQILRDDPEHKKGTNARAEMTLPIEKRKQYDWDKEEVDVAISDEGKIEMVSFDELYDHLGYCTSLQELAIAYKAGKTLSPSEVKLLADYKYIEPSTDVSSQEGILTLAQSGEKDIPFSPLFAFPYAIPSELAEKVKGQSKGNSYSTGDMDIGPLRINTRLHDYGNMQFVVNLDTRNLTNEEAWQLISTYVDTLKAFPRVQKQKDS